MARFSDDEYIADIENRYEYEAEIYGDCDDDDHNDDDDMCYQMNMEEADRINKYIRLHNGRY